jgi:predicted alpha/beta superfamily hydrolase
LKKQSLATRLLVFTLLLLLSFSQTHAQYKLSLKLEAVPASQAADSIYVAGSFNGWNPGDKKYLFKKNGKAWEISIPNLAPGQYEFKFTRGGWDKVATGRTGAPLGNYVVQLRSDTSLLFKVEGWQDHFPPVPKKHTASRNVHLVDSAFAIPQLGRSRRIWVYLPRSYKTSKKAYPVLYMQDGQNVFDDYSTANGEWEIDETLDSLTAKGQPESIVVAIENGPKRLNEYNPYDNERFGPGEAAAYVQFLAKTLKPYIDKNYRTRKESSATMIAGSSMGGLVSYYAMLAYPDVFGKAGIFSPSFWIAPAITGYTDSVSSKVNGKLFFYVGGMEGNEAVEDMYEVMQHLGTHSSALVYGVTDPGGKHNEAAWRKWFPEFYKFIMADWTNYPIPLKN